MPRISVILFLITLLVLRSNAEEPLVCTPSEIQSEEFAKAADRSARYWYGSEININTFQVKIKYTDSKSGTGLTNYTITSEGIKDVVVTLSGTTYAIRNNVIPHEMDHLVRVILVNRKIPRWLDEGCAIMMESESEKNRHRLKAAEFPKGTLTVSDLESYEYTEDNKDYYLGFSLVEFMIQAQGSKILFAFQRDPRPVKEKIKDYYHCTPEALLENWEEWRLNPPRETNSKQEESNGRLKTEAN